MHYLVIDSRFASPVYAFLEQNPQGDRDFPHLTVHPVTLEMTPESSARTPYSSGVAIGQNPNSASDYRLFHSDRAVRVAGFGLIEPRYVGATWASYTRVFPFGTKTPRRD